MTADPIWQRTWTATRTTPLFRVEADVAGTRIMGVWYALRDERDRYASLKASVSLLY